MAARLSCKQQAAGSIPVSGSETYGSEVQQAEQLLGKK